MLRLKRGGEHNTPWGILELAQTRKQFQPADAGKFQINEEQLHKWKTSVRQHGLGTFPGVHELHFRCVLEQAGEVGTINGIVFDQGRSLGGFPGGMRHFGWDWGSFQA